MTAERPFHLTDRVKLDLLRLIEADDLKPGDKVPPADQLCLRFSVSRTVVREAIASLKAEGRLRSLRGTKGRIEDFERSGFIRRVNGERVELEYNGMDPGLFDNITRADVRWLCGLFSRLSDRQLNDAFRAAGFAEELSDRYIRKIKEKVAKGAAL